jgi:hypothetical protein
MQQFQPQKLSGPSCSVLIVDVFSADDHKLCYPQTGWTLVCEQRFSEMHDLYIQKFGDGFSFSEEIKQRVIALKAEFQDLRLYFEKDPEVCVFSPLYTTIL